jgi:hypothetical protein
MTQASTDSAVTPQLFGDFIVILPPQHDSLELIFTPSSRPIKQRWKNNRLSAHFVADYFTNFLPIDENDPSHERRIKESKAAVSYVANELLENAIKFNDESSNYKVKFGIHFLEQDNQVVAAIYAINSVRPEGVDKLKAFIEELLSSDPGELYVRQIEKSVEEDTKASGLGLLTMMNDYSAKVGWKLETVQTDRSVVTVTTMAQVAV